MELEVDEMEYVHALYETDSGVHANGLVKPRVVNSPGGYWTRVSISPEDVTVMSSGTASAIYTGLRVLLGEFPLIEDTDVVPVKIATESKPVIAAYLLATHYENEQPSRAMKRDLANRMDITYGSFQEYVGRARREAMEYLVSGSNLRWVWRW